MAPPSKRISYAERRRQIIQVAMELFGRQGFKGTTTKEIARGARINESILFRHFRHKEDLYWAVLDGKCRVSSGRKELQKRLAACRDPQQALTSVAEDILRRNNEDPARSRLFLYSALENHRLSHRFYRTHVARYFNVLAGYIRERVRAGEFRPVDPLLAAQGFIGMVAQHYQLQELFGGKRHVRFVPRRVSAEFAGLWLRGIEKRDVKRHSRVQSPKRSR